jgi:Domain of unknown function (DUF4279)
MASKLATSSMKPDATLKAFATFRVAGDDLAPDELTELLGVQPTLAYRKGESYSTGRSIVCAPTGVWMFNTDRVLRAGELFDHIKLLLFVLGLLKSPNEDTSSSRPSVATGGIIKLLKLKDLLQQRGLTATMTFFWHGGARAQLPEIFPELVEVLGLLSITVETDFDCDEASAPRRARAA